MENQSWFDFSNQNFNPNGENTTINNVSFVSRNTCSLFLRSYLSRLLSTKRMNHIMQKLY